MVGAFTEAEVTPLVERWLASLPCTGKRTATFRDMGVRFPMRRASGGGQEGSGTGQPDGDVVFRRYRTGEIEMHRARAAATLVGIRLRDILRESWAAPTGSASATAMPPPQKGYGAMTISVRQRARPRGDAAESRAGRADAPARRGAVGRGRAEGAGAGAPRPRDVGAAEPVLDGLVADRPHARLGSGRHRPPRPAHRGPDRAAAARDHQEVLPAGSLHGRHAASRSPRPDRRRQRLVRPGPAR